MGTSRRQSTTPAGSASPEITRKRGTSLGFTIVELMIVIVVIAILAAISIVAYTGVQNRAYGSAVQTDLRQLSTKLDLYFLDGNTLSNSDPIFREVGFEPSRNAYEMRNNMVWCLDVDTLRYGVIGMARGGTTFKLTSDSGVQVYEGEFPSGHTAACANIGFEGESIRRGWLIHGGNWHDRPNA